MSKKSYKDSRNYFKDFIKDIFDEDFWFGDDKVNKAIKTYSNKDQANNTLQNINILELKNRIVSKNSEVEYQDKSFSNFKDILIKEDVATPHGYVKLYLNNIDINKLFLKHNITLKYLNIGNELFIKSFILGNENKEIDCFHLGENESITIEKHNNSIIYIKVKETSGQEISLSIVNGIVLN